jgi:hypothetical protein
MRILFAVACLVALAGCAGARFGAADCGPDWYAIGHRDGILGAYPQSDLYARRCDAPVDAARYGDGWRDGNSKRPRAPV